MVMTVSNIHRMFELAEIEGGRTAAATATTRSINASTEVSLVKEGGGGATTKDSTLRHLELALI